jgi:putative oxidoreductase
MKKLMNTSYSETSLSIALFLLRAAAGAMMIPHGYNKLNNFSKYAAGFTDPFHIGGSASLSLCIFAEFFCGIFIVLGLFSRLASIPLIITMAVVVFYVFHGQIFGKAELPALYLAIFIAILFTGPGKFSLDKMIGK